MEAALPLGRVWGRSLAVPHCLPLSPAVPCRPATSSLQPWSSPTSSWGPGAGYSHPPPHAGQGNEGNLQIPSVFRRCGGSHPCAIPACSGTLWLRPGAGEPESSGREKYLLTSRLCSPGLTRWIISCNPSSPWLLSHFSFCSFSSSLPFLSFFFQTENIFSNRNSHRELL